MEGGNITSRIEVPEIPVEAIRERTGYWELF